MDDQKSQPTIPEAERAPFPVPAATPPETAPERGLAVPDQLGLAMKRRGSVAVWLGLPLITFGIYHLVWYYKIHKELKRYDESQELSPLGSMLVLLLLGWTVVAPLISYYNTGEAIAKAQRRAGIPVTCSPVACMLLYFVFGLNVWYMQKQLNLIVEAYPGARPGEEVPVPAAGRLGLP